MEGLVFHINFNFFIRVDTLTLFSCFQAFPSTGDALLNVFKPPQVVCVCLYNCIGAKICLEAFKIEMGFDYTPNL